MVRQLILGVAAAAGFGAEAATAQQPAAPIAITAHRFFRPGDGATAVEVVVDVALGAVAPDSGAAARYSVDVSVEDSAGTELTRGTFTREVPTALARLPGATATETFQFAAVPGRYVVRVRARSAGREAAEQQLPVRMFAERPLVSDLVLATAVRASDTAEPGEVRRGGMALRTAALPTLMLDSARLVYYMEVYPRAGASISGALGIEVWQAASGGRRMIGTPPRPVNVEGAGGVTRGAIDLTGLPEGQYRFRVALRLGDTTIASEGPFAVRARPAAVAAVPAAPAAPADVIDRMTEAGLDSLYGPVQYLLEDSERGTYPNLSAAGKRRFLREVLRRRSQSAGDAAISEFLRLVAYVNGTFREAGVAGIQGYATDRGRIYLRHGRPDDVLRRPSASPRPYEVWKYMRGRMRYYIFWDRTGLGNYELIGTNDVREPSTTWELRLGRENALAVMEFIR